MVIAEVLVVPILTVPLVAPVPALILTLPPVPLVPVSFPAVKFKVPPIPELVVVIPGCRERAVPARVVISGV